VRFRKQRAVKWKSVHAKRLLKFARAESIPDAVATIACSLLEGVQTPPTDLSRLAEKLGVVAIKAEPMPITGELRRVGDGFEIAYSSDLPIGRRRFTIAHELAHAYLERTQGRCRPSMELENLCDAFATEFLMPRDVFCRIRKNALSSAQILEIAKRFGVSLLAVARRCHELLDSSVFEVLGEEVTWGCGLVRRGPVNSIYHDDIRSAARDAVQGAIGERLVFIDRDGVPRRHLISYQSLSKERGRALLLIRRAAS
jgi:hypothetical protein